MVDDEEPVLLRVCSQDEIHDDDLRSVAGSESVEPEDIKTFERLKRLWIVVVAVLVTVFAGLVGAQSTAPAVQVDQTSQTKQNQKIASRNPLRPKFQRRKQDGYLFTGCRLCCRLQSRTPSLESAS